MEEAFPTQAQREQTPIDALHDTFQEICDGMPPIFTLAVRCGGPARAEFPWRDAQLTMLELSAPGAAAVPNHGEGGAVENAHGVPGKRRDVYSALRYGVRSARLDR